MIKKINFNHSLIFFNICIILSSISYLKDNSLTIFCLFLILTIGISHGALDNIKGKNLLKIFKINSIFVFYIGYILISLLIILIWILFPKSLLLIFLFVASYHFGKEDTDFLVIKKNFKNELLYFFKGSIVITSPLLFHKNETVEIFRSLNFELSESLLVENNFLYFCLILSLISGLFFIYKKNYDLKSLVIMDYFSILILNYFLNPIIAFTIYFCFLHSLRHSLSLILELDKNIKKGFFVFIKKAAPLTLITAAAYLISLFYLNNYHEIEEAVYKVIFIGLASLTFPHILLEYLIEKNER
jgi:Brp/Blh family beta-carotene 15,15'-monooxygenase